MPLQLLRICGIVMVFVGTLATILCLPTTNPDMEDRDGLVIGRELLLISFAVTCVIYIVIKEFYENVVPPFAHRFGFWKDEMMTFPELAAEARRRHGWKILQQDSFEILDLIDGIAQATSEGRVTAYGRHNPQNFSNLRIIYLQRIPSNHWQNHVLEAFSAILINNNLKALSRPQRDTELRNVYMDVRVNRSEALKWLRLEGPRWKGQHDKSRHQSQINAQTAA